MKTAIYWTDENTTGTGHGSADLYISFADHEGAWIEPVNLGASINSADYDFCAMLSPDGEYLFWTSRNDIYWVDSEVIERLRPVREVPGDPPDPAGV